MAILDFFLQLWLFYIDLKLLAYMIEPQNFLSILVKKTLENTYLQPRVLAQSIGHPYAVVVWNDKISEYNKVL